VSETGGVTSLSDTELEILRMVATGATNREVARERNISEATVKKHLTNVNAKLGTANRTEAVRRALELGWVTVSTPADAAEKPDMEAARRLAQELERTRRRSRQLTGWLAATAVLLVAAAAATAYALASRPTPAPAAAGTPIAGPTPTPSWLLGVNLPSPLSGAAMVADPDDDGVFVISGREEAGLTRRTMRYARKEFRWRTMADKPTPVESVSGVVLRGEVLVPGGCLADGRATEKAEMYSPRDDAWRAVADLPGPRCGYALAELGGEAYLFGGRTGGSAAEASESVWRYDAAADAWNAEGAMPLPRSDLAAVAVGTRIHLLGGRDRAGRLQASHWVYDPYADPDDRWDVDGATPLPEGRAGLAAVRTPLGAIHVAGGGWDRRLEDGTIVLSRGGEWMPDSPLPVTPLRGAPMAVSAGGWIVLVGGEFQDRLLERTYLREAVVGTIFVPSR
jgi:DNA-binding CsgD family transcriptional regulator